MSIVKKLFHGQILFLFGIVSLIITLLITIPIRSEKDISGKLALVFPEAKAFNQVQSKPVVFEAVDDQSIIGYAVIEEATGYQSLVKVLTGIKQDGTITNVVVVAQHETPTFFQRLYDKKYFDQYIKKDIASSFDDSSVTAITNATLSSNAVKSAVAKGSYFVAENYLHTNVASPYNNISFGGKEISITLLMVMALIASFTQHSNLRYPVLILSILVVGFYFHAFIAYSYFVSILLGKVPVFTENMSWYILVVGTLLVILLTGKNIFCQWICPFGAMQVMLSKLSGVQKVPSSKLINIARYIPGFLAWISLMLALTLNNISVLTYEPFGTLFAQVGNRIQWIVLPLILVAALIYYRFWCMYFCPVGYVLGLMTKIRGKVKKIWKNASCQETKEEKVSSIAG